MSQSDQESQNDGQSSHDEGSDQSDLTTKLIDLAVNKYSESQLRQKLSFALQAIVSSISIADVEKKYTLIEALRNSIDDDLLNCLINNQYDLYGEPWDCFKSNT